MSTGKTKKSLWIKATNGVPSMSATFATVAFVTTTLIYVASIFEKIGPVSIRPFDAAACGAYLIPVLSLYFGRRWADNKVVAPVVQSMAEAVAASQPAEPDPKAEER